MRCSERVTIRDSQRNVEFYSILFGIINAILYIYCFEAVTLVKSLIKIRAGLDEDALTSSNEDHSHNDVDNMSGEFQIFIFGSLCYWHMHQSGMLIIKFPAMNTCDGFFGSWSDRFSFKEYFRIWNETMKVILLINVLAHDYKNESFLWWSIIVRIAAINFVWIVLWLLYNISLSISQATLRQEIGLPVRYPTALINGQNSHISDIMRFSDDEDGYLQHLAVYEFFQVCMHPTRIKDMFSLKVPNSLTGFEKALDASFCILDNFQTALQQWLEQEGEKMCVLDGGKAINVFGTSGRLDQFSNCAPVSSKSMSDGRCIGNVAIENEENIRNMLHSKMRHLASGSDDNQVSNPSPDIYITPSLWTLFWTLVKLEVRSFLEPFLRFMRSLADKILVYTLSPMRLLGYIFKKFKRRPRHPYGKLMNLLSRNIQLVNWTINGLVEMTTKSKHLDEFGIGQLYVKSVLACLLDFHETVTYLDEQHKNRPVTQTATDSTNKALHIKLGEKLQILKRSCKFGVCKMHILEKEYYSILKVEKELQSKIQKVCES